MESAPIPVWPTIKVGYRDFFRDFGVYARLALKPLVLACGLFVLIAVGIGAVGVMYGTELFKGIGGAIAFTALSIPVGACMLYFGLWVTRWRLLGSSGIAAFGRFSWGARERRYIGWGLLISLLAAFVIEAASSLDVPAYLSSAMITAVNTVAPTVIVARFALVFPAIAADVPDALRVGWRAARGSWLRLAAIYLVTFAPTYGFVLVPDAAALDSEQAITKIVTSLIFLIAIPVLLFASAAITAIASAEAFTWKFGPPS